jgi:hypothetical protein
MRLEPLISHTGILMTFYLKHVFNLSCGRVEYRVKKSKVLMEDT